MDSAENTENLTNTEENNDEINQNDKLNDAKTEEEKTENSENDTNNNEPPKDNKNESDTSQDNKNKSDTEKKKKRKRKNTIPSINLSALKELEGTTTSSFLDLAKAVILIDNAPYDETELPLSKARKIDFERLIAHYAQLEIYGKRKYHIKSVINRIQKEELNDVELTINKKPSYTKSKPLTEAQRKARKMLYEAKKEKKKREEAEAYKEIMEKAKEKISELEK